MYRQGKRKLFIDAYMYLGKFLWMVSEERRMHVAPGLAPLYYFPESVQVQLPLKAAELVV